jgi:hypothetical protein
MKQWEVQHNITKRGKKNYNKLFSQKNHQRARLQQNISNTLNEFDIPQTQHKHKDPSLFRPYNFTRGTKRKIQANTPALNNYHLTDWIFYTSSNFLHGGYWSKYISLDNNDLFMYYSSIDFFSFYYSFFLVLFLYLLWALIIIPALELHRRVSHSFPVQNKPGGFA